MTTQFAERLTKLPPVPKEFGEDGGRFYKYYDDLADELDEDMVTSLKSQLDGILIFAGLFAGVNSAFLAFTLPQLSADPAEDTNALLFQIMLGGNSTIRTPADLPSASFSPPAGAYPINVLFSMSLTLALLGSFLAVLGQQWLVYYRKRSGGGAERQRWEQLRRYLGAKRWKLELILDDVLPSVLQVALVIFCVAFSLYLGTLSKSLSYAIATPLCAAGTIIVMMAFCAAWDDWCPFKSPLSHLTQSVLQYSMGILGRIMGILVAYAFVAFDWVAYKCTYEDASFVGSRPAALNQARTIGKWFICHAQRTADATDYLKFVALKRVLCTSDDPNALVHAATNAQSISQGHLLKQILNDSELRSRFENLDTVSMDTWIYDQPVTIQNTAIARSLFYMVLAGGSVEDFLHYEDRVCLEGRVDDPDYGTNLMININSKFASFFVMDALPMDNECPGCSHCVTLEYCMRMMGVITSLTRPELLRIKPHHLKQPIHVMGASKSVGLAWMEAWAIMLLHEWDQISGGENELNQSAEVEMWQLKKMREFLRLYQDMDITKFGQTISQAISTSAIEWQGRPNTEVYVKLIEQELLIQGDSDRFRFNYGFGSSLINLLTLLRSIENRIHNVTTSTNEREGDKEYRRECIENWISYVEEAYGIDGNVYDDGEKEIFVLRHGPLWIHCTDASTGLLEYTQRIKDILKVDPENGVNPSMIKLVTFLYNCLEDPDKSLEKLEKEESTYKRTKKLHESKIQPYRQFYIVFAQAVSEIESILAGATTSVSKVSRVFQGYLYF
ncbi:hypothetical protein FRC01_010924 [Tulasnella sp. 417]|nr:hypothetical protein FRC01_010924 [Tulasnella sp. 417]